MEEWSYGVLTQRGWSVSFRPVLPGEVLVLQLRLRGGWAGGDGALCGTLRRAGVANLGVDLIAGLPVQTENSWEHTLAVACEAELEHLSVYLFEIDEKSRLGREVLNAGARLLAPAVPGDEAMAVMYERACDLLPKHGFAQYEISNFARAGFLSRHNLRYWHRDPYLGFGLDAHSMLLDEKGAAVRWANPAELASYRPLEEARWRTVELERVDERQAFEETVFLGLRLADGLPLERFASFPKAWVEEAAATAVELAEGELLQIENGLWRLTQRGQLLSNEVFGELLGCVAV